MEHKSDAMFWNIMQLYAEWLRMKRNRRCSVRPANQDRLVSRHFRKVFLKIKYQDPEQFFIHTRMTRPVYDLLLNLVRPYLEKPGQIIGAEERLCITLKYLAHGLSFQAIAWCFKMGKTTVRNIVLETCETLWTVLSPVYLSEPSESRYRDIEKDFRTLWNMPNCVGAIEGKHVAIACPKNSSSLFFNYKKFYSIVLMATCDAKYTFTSVNVGGYGSQSDGGILRNSQFGKDLIQGNLPLPPDGPLLQGSNEYFPHYFVGNAAFPLRTNLMRPFPGTQLPPFKDIFNYRLSRARRTIENSFGILTARWRVMRSVIECSPDNAEKIVLGCVVLHNFVMLNDSDHWYCPENYADYEDDNHELQPGNWQSELSDIGGSLYSIRSVDRNSSAAAFHARDTLAHYFANDGAVSFQCR